LKITELKLKENITLQDKVNVIEETAKACFTVDENMNIVYTPYFKDIVFVAECLRNFFDKNGYDIIDHVNDDGVNVEVSDDVIHDYIYAERLHQEMLDKIRTKIDAEYLIDMIDEKIDFEKQRVIQVEQNAILSMVSDKLYDIACIEEIRVQKEIEALDRMSAVTQRAGEQISFQERVNELLPAEKQAELAEKLAEGNVSTRDVLDTTLKEMINHGHFDKESREILDAKNEELRNRQAKIVELAKALEKVNKE